ncbi:MAG: hypothetical protein LKJ43_03130 [Lentilactobacillus buchneri]|nr:hypothetical protein [Lentilactobacillus buchneri]MCI1950705.1 hypothetical protein [Lentilactobacillus buchneri]MCI2027831.1 hypothetical protein [Lentilactobacillus buchneri]
MLSKYKNAQWRQPLGRRNFNKNIFYLKYTGFQRISQLMRRLFIYGK